MLPLRDDARSPAPRTLRIVNSVFPIRKDLHRIVLTGFMGSGKTPVGRILSERLGWQFADLDHVVESREGRSVPHIFAESGEGAFRSAEAQVLADLPEDSTEDSPPNLAPIPAERDTT